ncbi:MAG: class I fructose-bisphosphate aldolase [Candidatus Paceibacterota bacterium]|jgi:fructose-bisphosphate aldolase class I
MINKQEKLETIKKIFSQNRGILAADESIPTATKRLASINLESTPETRKKYREIFLTTPEIEKYISGVIFFDETFRQSVNEKIFPQFLAEKGIIPGIKVDKGVIEFPASPTEKITDGLIGLPERMAEYYALGARFAKWRAIITIGEGIPTDACIQKNAEILAEYAKDCIEVNIVPIIEPEVLLDGDHTIAKSEEVTTKTLQVVFQNLKNLQIPLDEVILKTSMVIPGNKSGEPMDSNKIAEATVRCLRASVPNELGGVVFLSGGQTPIQATENLNVIAKLGPFPWPLSFSYARALQGPSLKIWQGKDENIPVAQAEFIKRLKLNSAAVKGVYDAAME